MIRHQYQPKPAVTPAAMRSCRATLVDRMADDMREMAFAGETVSTETLVSRGWSRETVERFGAEAIRRARRRSIRQIAEA